MQKMFNLDNSESFPCHWNGKLKASCKSVPKTRLKVYPFEGKPQTETFAVNMKNAITCYSHAKGQGDISRVTIRR